MKKILLLFSITLLFITCKKDKKVTPVIDATGTWTLYSWNSDIPTNINATADQHPCMSENVLTFNKDMTYTSSFIGKDTCYVTTVINTNTGFNLGTIIGIPGQPVITGNWHQEGNVLYTKVDHGIISNVNGKTLVTFIDTINYSGTKHLITTIDIKQ